MFSGMLAGFLKVAAVALVTGGFAGALLAAACSGDGTEPEPTIATITPESTAAPTAIQEPVPTDPPTPTATALPPTQPLPTEAPPVPTADTRVPIRDLPTADQIQLGKDGKYFGNYTLIARSLLYSARSIQSEETKGKVRRRGVHWGTKPACRSSL